MCSRPHRLGPRAGGEAAGSFIGGVSSTWPFSEQCLISLARPHLIQLRRRFPNIERPYRSPFGVVGAALTVIIALVTIGFQLADPVYRTGVIGVAIWYALAIIYFAAYGGKTLIFSPRGEAPRRCRPDVAARNRILISAGPFSDGPALPSTTRSFECPAR